MLDAILRDEIRSSVDTVTLFAFADAPDLAAALRLRGLSVDRYWYLGRDLQRVAPPRLPDVRQWRLDDVQATAELLGRAYEGRDESRPFAPRGMAEEWTDYVHQLTTGTGCGRLITDVSVCVPGGPNRLLAVALVTRIAETTAHLAQLAVDPQMRGRHLGKQLLEVVCAAANQAGCTRMTLFVGGTQQPRALALRVVAVREHGELSCGGNASAAAVDERGAGQRRHHPPVGGQRRFSLFHRPRGIASRQLRRRQRFQRFAIRLQNPGDQRDRLAVQCHGFVVARQVPRFFARARTASAGRRAAGLRC